MGMLRKYISDELRVECRSFRISMVLGLGELILMSMISVLLRMDAVISVLLLAATALTVAAIVLEKRYGHREVLSNIYMGIVYLGIVPALSQLVPNAIYDFSLYFVTGIIIAAVLFKGRQALLFILAELAMDVLCLYRMVELTTGAYTDFNEFQSYNATLYARIILSLVITGSVCGILITYRNKILRKEMRNCAEMEQQAEQVNYAKDMFLVNVSHEIRTPLNAIMGTAEMLLDSDAAENVRESAMHINNSSKALLSITNDLMSFSRLDYENMKVEKTDYSIRFFMEDMINMLSVQLADNRIESFVHIDPELPEDLVGDPTLIKQAVMGLVTGVVRSMQEGTVTFCIDGRKNGDGTIQLSTVIHAKGAFQHFYKELIYAREISRDNKEPLVERIVQVLGGTLTIEENPKQRMYEFSVSQEYRSEKKIVGKYEPGLNVLYFENSRTQADFMGEVLRRMGVSFHAVSTNEEFVRECTNKDYRYIMIAAERYEGLRERLTALMPPQSLILISPDMLSYDDDLIRMTFSRPVNCISLDALFANRSNSAIIKVGYHGNFECPDARVMVVDDNLINLEVAGGILSRYKAQVLVASSGAECLNTLAHDKVDLIFLDYMMPEMDGIDTLKNIRAMDRREMKELPVIALTANAVSGAREMFLEAGFDEYISKPIELDKFEKLLRKYLPQEKILFKSGKEAEHDA